MEENNAKLNDDEEDDEFEISSESFASDAVMDLGMAIAESKRAINLFCSNQFDEASRVFKPWIKTSMYHALGYSSYLFLEAILTYEQGNIQKAIEEIDRTIKLCESQRRKQTYLSTIKKLMNISISNQYSSEEIHAELLYAESLSLKSILSFLDEKSNTFTGFFKAGLKMRHAFNSYKDCEALLNYLQSNGENHDIHFETGVRVGIGCFNIIISHLPLKIIRLLEFVGFSGDKKLGISEVMRCYQLTEGLRQIGSVMVLLIYNLVMMYFIGNSDGNLELCDTILNAHLKNYPVSAVFFFFKGRLEFLKGDTKQSTYWHTKSWKSQSVWPHLHHFCFWEMMWNCILIQDWKQAETFSDLLVKGSKWSRTIFYYQKAAIMLMRYNELNEEEKKEVNRLMTEVPNYKQRVAGKSIPMEKFCIKKSMRYKLQNNRLVLPVYELLFVWNLFKPLCKNRELCLSIYNSVTREHKHIDEITKETKSLYDVDNTALLLFLEGLCLVQLNDFFEAEKILKSVVALEKRIKEDLYIVPYSYIELANIQIKNGAINEGVTILEDIKTKYTGYSLENRLHFQVHSALEELKSRNGV